MLDYVISRVFCFIAIRFMHSSKILKWIERYLYTVLLFNYSSEGHMLNMETWLHILVDLLMLYWTVTCVESRNFFTISWKCKGHFFLLGEGDGVQCSFLGGNFSVSRSPLYLGMLLLLGNDSLIYYMNHYIFIMMIFTKILYIFKNISFFMPNFLFDVILICQFKLLFLI